MGKFAVILFLLVNTSGCSAGSSSNLVTETIYEKISIIGDKTRSGIFDPSVEYDRDGVGWLAYSRVELPKYVETHIAKSTNHGKTWKYVTAINNSGDGKFNYQGKVHKGVWRSETPSLLYDYGDISSRRWKLFSHRYPARPPFTKGNHLYAEGWIEFKYAATPEGPWSKPIRLFGKSKDNCLIDLNSIHPAMRNFLWFNEIGSIVIDGVIYLSLDASTTPTGLGEWRKRKIVLISSADHGKSWRYVGELTNFNDANSHGYLIFTGSSLVKEGKHLFLLASPSGAKGLFKKNRAHDGTIVVKIEDITRAKLKREANGKLAIRKWFKPVLHSGGLSDYDEQNTHGGILFSQINTNNGSRSADFFQVFSTREYISKPTR